MIAKIITHRASREESLGAMRAALSETRVAGLETNAAFLHALAAEKDFIKGDVSTKFIDEHEKSLFAAAPAGPKQWAAAALWKRKIGSLHPEEQIFLRPSRQAFSPPQDEGKFASRRTRSNTGESDPWNALSGFRLNRPRHEVMWIEHDGHVALLRLSKSGDGYNATLEPDASAAARREGREPVAPVKFSFSGAISDGEARITMDDDIFSAYAAPHQGRLRIWIGADHWDIALPDPLAGISAHHSSEGSLTAPMPGVITLLSAKPGDAIAAGKPLLVMEAMKMEHAIKAPYDGVVKAYKFKAGDQVKDGDLLVEFEESA